MSEPTRRQSALVGLFVLFALVICAGGIFTVGKASSLFSRTIIVHATFADVSGLQPGHNIWYAGVKVGTVKAVRFAPDAQVAVDLGIERGAAAFLRDDLVAKISSDGLIGNRIVALVDPVDEAGEPLAVRAPIGSLGADETLATGVAPSTETLMAEFRVTNAKLQAVATDVLAVTGRIRAGEGSVGRLLAEDRVYEDLSAAVASAGNAASNAEVATGELAAYTQRLSSPDTLPGQLVNDRETWARLTDGVAKLQGVAAHAESVVGGLDAATHDPETPLGTLLHDDEAGADLKASLDHLAGGAARLEEDLAAAQHTIFLRGGVKKVRKEAEARAAREAAAERIEETAPLPPPPAPSSGGS